MDAVSGLRILLNGVDVAVAAKGVLLINPPASSPIGVETRVGIGASANLAHSPMPYRHPEAFLHPNLEPFGTDVVLVCEVPGFSLPEEQDTPSPDIFLQLEGLQPGPQHPPMPEHSTDSFHFLLGHIPQSVQVSRYENRSGS